MIALRVKLNDKELCLAGTEDLAVLHAIVNAVGILGSETKKVRKGAPDLFLSVGGLTGRESGVDYHLNWVDFHELKIGDKIEVELVEISKADKPSKKSKAAQRSSRTEKRRG